MIKIGEFAKLIGRSIQTLRNWEKCGVLIPFKTINRVRYYSEAQLKQFIDNGGFKNIGITKKGLKFIEMNLDEIKTK